MPRGNPQQAPAPTGGEAPRARAPMNNQARRRMNREAVHQSAVQGSRPGGGNILRPPDGVNSWRPEEKDEEYLLRFMPYEVTRPGHPDGRQVGDLWYRRAFWIHWDVGGTGVAVLCPRTFGKPCPICEEVKRLSRDYDKNEDQIKELRARSFMAYVAFDVHDPSTVFIFDWSQMKFSDVLENELKKPKSQPYWTFADVEEGSVVKMRTAEGEFAGKKYIKVDRIDFLPAKQFTNLTEEQLAAVPKLDECFQETDYDTIDALFHGVPPEQASEVAAERGTQPTGKPAPTKKAPPPPKEEPAGDDDWGGDTSTAPENDDGQATGSDEDETQEEPCVACGGTGRNSKGGPCAVCAAKKAITPPHPKAVAANNKPANKPTGKPAPTKKAPPPPKEEPAGDDDWGSNNGKAGGSDW